MSKKTGLAILLVFGVIMLMFLITQRPSTQSTVDEQKPKVVEVLEFDKTTSDRTSESEERE